MATELVDRAAPERETGEVIDFPQVRIDSRFVVKQQGRDYVLSDGLIDGLHALSGGSFDVSTEIVQLPTPDNGHLAVCAAKVTVFSPDADGRVLRVATGLGDASPQSVNRMILPHLIRMAETRALSRALRTLLNVGAVAFEELGPQAEEADHPRSPQTRQPEGSAQGRDGAGGSTNRVPIPAGTAAEHIVVGDRTWSREEVTAAYLRRREQAASAGLALGEAIDPEVLARAPLSVIVGHSQQLKRRLEQQGSSGK